MKRWLKISLISLTIIFICFCGATGWFFSKASPIVTGFVAKYLCSSTFISKRDPGSVFQEDVAPITPLTKVISWKIDHKEQSVVASSFWLFRLKAIYREGCGCTLVQGTTEEQLRKQGFYKLGSDYTRLQHQADLPWPQGSQGPIDPESLGIDITELQKALDAAFEEPTPDNPRKTRAILIVYDGHLIAERYAPGFNPQMPLLGWSMGKSITNALVGILVRKGMLDLSSPAPVPEWEKPNDPRQKISLDQLLRMRSGLEFEEVYEPLTDVSDMLYASYDFASYAAQKPLETEPDTKWHYSSGTANIVARIVRQEAEKLYENYYMFLHQELFDKIGMYSALIEPDGSGTFVGSSYAVATPRDWARFALLYLHDGVWNGERIFPEGWVEYTTTPTAKAPKGEYGAHFWLNAGAPFNLQNRLWPDAPVDAFAARGFQEQYTIIIPSKKLILVRFGATAYEKAWSTNEFIGNVLKALPD